MRRTAEILQKLRSMDTRLERLDVAIITRYPDSERAADNYEALRKALIVSGSAASRHVSDLLTLATALDEGATTQTIRLKINDLLQVLDVAEIAVDQASEIPEHRIRDYFDIVGDKAHPRSAWLRMQDGVPAPVRKGYLAELPVNAGPTSVVESPGERHQPPPAEEAIDQPAPSESEAAAPDSDGLAAPAPDSPADPESER